MAIYIIGIIVVGIFLLVNGIRLLCYSKPKYSKI
jgi:hypothetical protein